MCDVGGAVGREGGGEGALGFLAHGEEGRHVVAGAASADSISATCPFLLCITNAGGFVHHLAHCVEDRYLRLAVRIVDYAIPDRLAPWENSICVFLLPRFRRYRCHAVVLYNECVAALVISKHRELNDQPCSLAPEPTRAGVALVR